MDRSRAVRRPNGKIYVPRKGLTIIGFQNVDFCIDDYTAVLRTHDVREAVNFARCGYVSAHLTAPETTWIRLGYFQGEPSWVYDPVRGTPAVVFLEQDDPDPEVESLITRD